jgi:hypothetical protein
LDRLARGRLRAEWDQTAALMSWVGRVGKWVDPNRLNPFHREPPRTEEQERAESRTAFKLLERGLKDLIGVR